MAEKNIKSRIVHKHDLESNWLLATNFTPKQGEIIVYDIDDNYDYERIKIGDGVQNVNSLPFIDDATRETLIEQINAVDDKVDAVSTLVGDTSVSYQINKALLNSQADLSQNDETAADYVKGRTHWVGDSVEEELVNVTVTTESYFSKDMGATLDIIAGKEYTVIHNGVTYNLVGENDAQGYGVYLGNGYIFSSNNTANDTPFLIFSYYSDFSLSIYPPKTETETVERHIVIKTVNTEIHKLDTMFIPDEVIVGTPGAGLKSVILNDTTTNLTDGDYSYAGGLNTNASAHCASAHNSNTTASGACSTAMGANTKATAYAAFSSGFYTEATGQYSHVEGESSVASGTDSHAEGEYTIAASYAQHAQGKFNIEDADGKYAHIVGNGERPSARSNAHTLDWDGNAWFAGDVYIGGTSQDDAEKLVKQSELPAETVIDSTLTQSGQAADAKVTGDSISALNTLVGDTAVSEQVAIAVSSKADINHTHDAVFLKTVSATLPSSEEWNAITYGGDKFVAIAKDTNKAAYSIDGINWTLTTLPSSASWVDVTYGYGRFMTVARGTNKAAYSTDGINWTASTMTTSGDWCSITYGGTGMFIAIAPLSLTYAYSYTGASWNTGSLSRDEYWSDIASNGSTLVVVGEGTSIILVSSDASTWDEIYHSCPGGSLAAVAYGDNKFVAISKDSGEACYSPYGDRWTTTSIGARSWCDLVYGADKFITVASNTNIASYSTDGISWIETTLPITANWSRVAYGNGVYVAISKDSDAVVYSYDGINWVNGYIALQDKNGNDVTTQIESLLTGKADCPKLANVTLSAANWTGSTNPYSQVITINGVTENSKIDLQPTATQIVELQNADIMLMVENNDGTITAYAIGGKPTADYTMQALITEVVPV